MSVSSPHLARLLLLASASPALHAPALAASSSYVIQEDTTWSRQGSPYTVSADMMVASGATLTIEPGVTVELDSWVSITVEGTLVARGSSQEPIVLRGVEGADGRVRWGSLIFAEGSVGATYQGLDEYLSGSVLEHCEISDGSRAVAMFGSSPLIRECYFHGNYYESDLDVAGGAAIYVDQGSAPRISDSTFSGNIAGGTAYGGAIYVDQGSPIIQGNTFTANESVYGAALSAYAMYSPIVGNLFQENISGWDGGAIALVSSAPAILDNEVLSNEALYDGGGIHVCIDCNPHANPFITDNSIIGNTCSFQGAAGVGAAYLRSFSGNDIHDNLRSDVPADFAWFNQDTELAWTRDLLAPGNWWGSTDAEAVAEAIWDGNDDPVYGLVDYQPMLDGPSPSADSRVTITTDRLEYSSPGTWMPVYLTIYNPGQPRQVELLLLLQHGNAPPLAYRGELGFPGSSLAGDSFLLDLPEGSVFFDTLGSAQLSDVPVSDHGTWYAALFDPETGDRIGDLCSARFDTKGDE